jgi:hypothetical protein
MQSIASFSACFNLVLLYIIQYLFATDPASTIEPARERRKRGQTDPGLIKKDS